MALTFFITGCSTGLGLVLTQKALALGHKVISTIRHGANAQALHDLNSQYADHHKVLFLDVTDTASIPAVVHEAYSWAGRIDAVVNNAGYGLMGNVEGMDQQQIRHQMETNFFGALWITQAFLPLFRAQGGGRFMHISSVAGINASAGGAIYSASKFALEGMSEGLMREAAHLNIYSTLIEPGPFRTDWAGRSLNFATRKIEDYEASVGQMERYLSGANGNQKGDPEKAALAMIHLAEVPNPPFRLLLGAAAYRVFARKMGELQAEVEAWRHVGEPTDFPE